MPESNRVIDIRKIISEKDIIEDYFYLILGARTRRKP